METLTKGFAIGCVYFGGPAAGECYYLGMLQFATVQNPTFQYLLTYNSHIYNTFQAACLARGLIESDEESHVFLLEAATMQTGRQLPQLFLAILLFNHPTNAKPLLIDLYLPSAAIVLISLQL